MTVWLCNRCDKPVRNIYDQVEKRLEYRQKPKDNRRHVVLVERLCVTCADAEVEQMRPARIPGSTPQAML